MNESEQASSAASEAAKRARTRRMTNAIAGVLALATIIGLGLWLANRLAYVHVLDARVAATMVSVSSRTAGWIEALPIEEGDRIEQNALLMGIDNREARLQQAEREAELEQLIAERETLRRQQALVDDQTQSRLRSREAALSAAEAALRATEAEFQRAEADWQRASPMLEQEIISRQRWESLRAAYLNAQSRLDSARADLATARAAVVEAEANRAEVTVIKARLESLQHRIEEARAQRDRQQVVLDDHQLRSPVAGIVDEIFVDSGEFVSRGQRVLLMHDPEQLWVSANIKETELRRFDVGSRARVRVDAYPGQDLQARVARIGNATTSEFALLPTPNPSGNFTKITQRVQVRMEFEQPPELPLRPGMMVEVAIER